MNLGDFLAGSTVYVAFTTNIGTGARGDPNSAFEAADFFLYKNGSATERTSTAGWTITSTFDSKTGCHVLAIDLSDNTDAGFYSAGAEYQLFLYPDETIDSVLVSRAWMFSIERGVNVRKWLGTTVATPGTAGVPSVDTIKIGGTTQTAKDLGSLNLSSGKVLIQGTIDQFDDFVDAAGKVTLTAATIQAIWDALTSALTTVGSIGKKLADWVIGTTQTGDSYARLGTPAGASVSADIAAVKVDTAAVKVQTDKLVFTVANRVDANSLSVGGTAQTGGDIAALINALALYTTRVVARGTAAGASTTSITTSAFTPAGIANDQFKGRIVIFDINTATTALRGQATDITASDISATPTLTVTALTTAPAAGDTFGVY